MLGSFNTTDSFHVRLLADRNIACDDIKLLNFDVKSRLAYQFPICCCLIKINFEVLIPLMDTQWQLGFKI